MKFIHRFKIDNLEEQVEFEANTLPEWHEKFLARLKNVPRKVSEKIINRFREKAIIKLLGEEKRDPSLRLFSDL